MITQKDLEQLTLLKTEAEKSSLLFEQFQNEASEAVTKIAFKYYPLLKEMDNSYSTEFNDLLSRLFWEFSMEMEQFALEVES